MPPRSSRPPPPRKHAHRAATPLPAEAVARLDRCLVPAVPDARDRAFVLRCILEEGPPHHRGASFALLSVLSEAVERLGGTPRALGDAPMAPLRMRLPPHLGRAHDDDRYPLGLCTEGLERALREVGGVEAAVDALGDGPPHHALANAAMLFLIEALCRNASGASPALPTTDR